MHLAATELPSGFWSYVHKDNDAESGRILRLCDALKNEFGLLTARDLKLFTDREGISWGHKWRATIDNALIETTFFIAIVSPRYILSEECRRELLLFSQNARARGVPELLCPILYADVEGLDEDAEDEIKAAIAQAQYEPFTDLRLFDEQSPEYRRAVNRLALRLIEIANTIAAKELEAPTPTPPPTGPDEAQSPGGTALDPGVLDAAEAMSGQFEEWQQIVELLSQLMIQVGQITDEATPTVTEAGQHGSEAVNKVLTDYAFKLRPVAEEFRDTGARYAVQALSMNVNIVMVLNQLKKAEKSLPFDEPTYNFLEGLIAVADAGQNALASVRTFQQSAQEMYGLSRIIRPPYELLGEGAQRFLDGQALIDDWKRRSEEILLEHPRQQEPGSHEEPDT